MDIVQELDKLANFRGQKMMLDFQKQQETDKILTPEIKQALADLDAEFSDKAQAVNDNIANLEKDIKAAMLVGGFTQTVKGSFLQAVYSKPRISWDTKALDGYAAGHPEILQFRSVGEASISIRECKAQSGTSSAHHLGRRGT